MLGFAFILAVLIFFALGTPLFVILGAASMFCLHFLEGSALATIIGDIYQLVSNPVLVAIPLFTFAGFILAESGMPSRLVAFNRAIAGWIPGSLTLVTVVSCAVFTAFTGASGITIVALGGLLMPALMKDGYSEKFSLGLVTGSGCIGLLFPPSIPVILYGIVARVEINRIFLAGLVPGLIILVVFYLYGAQTSLRRKLPRGRFSFAEARKAGRACLWEMPLPFLVVGGIYGGLATVTETAALTVAYALIVEVAIYRDIPWSQLSRVCTESGKMVGAILLILCMALSFANFIVLHSVPDSVVEFMGRIVSGPLSFMDPKIAFLMLLNLLLLVVGCFLDIFSAILVVVPLILPIADGFGVNPLHLAVIFLVNLEIGYLTPPVGLNLFISSFRFRKNMLTVCGATLPFLLLLLVILAAITYFEPISLLLQK